jgi:hypothetical protein
VPGPVSTSLSTSELIAQNQTSDCAWVIARTCVVRSGREAPETGDGNILNWTELNWSKSYEKRILKSSLSLLNWASRHEDVWGSRGRTPQMEVTRQLHASAVSSRTPIVYENGWPSAYLDTRAHKNLTPLPGTELQLLGLPAHNLSFKWAEF